MKKYLTISCFAFACSGAGATEEIDPFILEWLDDPEYRAVDGETLRIDHAPELPSADEKGATSVLLGWAVKGHGVYQDGFPQTVNGVTVFDHCTGSQLSSGCDGEFHIQAADNYIDNITDWAGEIVSFCGDSKKAAFFPCALPHLKKPNGKTVTWRWDPTGCPSSSTGRTHIYQGIKQAITYLNNASTGVNFVEANFGETLRFTCGGHIEPFDGLTVAAFTPAGSLTLRYAAPYNVAESCETPSIANWRYTAKGDLVYTYSNAQVEFNWANMFNFITGCSTVTSNVRRIIRNIVVHEVGHYFGFTHQTYDNHDFDIMATDHSCSDLVNSSKGFHPYMVQAVEDMDTSTLSSGVDLWDNDLSCFGPR